MISKEDYLIALSIVEQYHNRLKKYIELTESIEKTDVKSWVEDNRYKMTGLLRGSLLMHYKWGIIKYIEDIDVKQLSTFRNVGVKSVKEFIKLRGY